MDFRENWGLQRQFLVCTHSWHSVLGSELRGASASFGFAFFLQKWGWPILIFSSSSWNRLQLQPGSETQHGKLLINSSNWEKPSLSPVSCGVETLPGGFYPLLMSRCHFSPSPCPPGWFLSPVFPVPSSPPLQAARDPLPRQRGGPGPALPGLHLDLLLPERLLPHRGLRAPHLQSRRQLDRETPHLPG